MNNKQIKKIALTIFSLEKDLDNLNNLLSLNKDDIEKTKDLEQKIKEKQEKIILISRNLSLEDMFKIDDCIMKKAIKNFDK